MYGATMTPNVDDYNTLNVGTLTGNTVINPPTGTPVDRQTFTVRFAQDATGGRVVDFDDSGDNGDFIFGADATEADIPTAANAQWEMAFKYHAGSQRYRCVGIARGF
jgi:hypothetical protein